MNFLVPQMRRYDWDQDIEKFFGSIQGEPMLSLAADIEESAENILMTFDLPGLKQEELSIKVADGVLTIAGERKREEKKSEKNKIVYSRRSFGKFSKSYTLPETVDEKKVEADYRDGVLRLYLPKTKVEKTESVEVKVKNKDTFFDKLLGGDGL